MANRGRPPSGKYNISEMILKIEEYADNINVPILKEICYINKWDYQYIMNLQAKNEQLRESIKRLLDKKEVDLERGTLNGKLEKTMAIFSLKQLGWKDKVEVEETGKSIDSLITIADLIRNPVKNRTIEDIEKGEED